MANVSPEWLSAISKGRLYSIQKDTHECQVPIMPWIHPPVDPRLQDLIRRLGTRRKLKRQEVIFSLDHAVSDLILVEQGVIARNFGVGAAGTGKAAAISPPGHIGSGNLNLFTSRPAFGRYFALTQAEVTACPKDILLSILKTDPELLGITLQHLEACTLSDRLGFALMAFGPVELRLKAFVIGWAVHYGKTYTENGKLMVRMPVPLTRNNRCLVANTSSVSTDNFLKKWKDCGAWNRDGDFVSFPADFFEDAYTWMRNSEEASGYQYKTTFEELMMALPELANPWY